jgi:hypothetical protein
LDVELGKLLEDAIEVNSKVLVDPTSKEGALFLNARPRHVRIAWDTIISLYTDANRSDLVAKAKLKAQEMADGPRFDHPTSL